MSRHQIAVGIMVAIFISIAAYNLWPDNKKKNNKPFPFTVKYQYCIHHVGFPKNKGWECHLGTQETIYQLTK